MSGSNAVGRVGAPVQRYWSLILYEAAAEAGGCRVPSLRRPRAWGRPRWPWPIDARGFPPGSDEVGRVLRGDRPEPARDRHIFRGGLPSSAAGSLGCGGLLPCAACPFLRVAPGVASHEPRLALALRGGPVHPAVEDPW